MFTGNAKAIARFCYCSSEHHTSFECDYAPDPVQDNDSNANRIERTSIGIICQLFNRAIDVKLCSLSYVTIIEVVDRAVQLDSASLIAIINIVTMLPNSSSSMWLPLVRNWPSYISVNAMTLGLRSAPKTFNCYSICFWGCIINEDVEHVFHYLDFRSDMTWWSNSVKFWNGTAMFIP